MFNYGNKRGYNNNSGWIYTQQGATNVMGDTPILPTYTEPLPQYENKEHVNRVLREMNNGLQIPKKGTSRLVLHEGEHLVGGSTKKMINAIDNI
jgi:hypothetical protein